MQICREALALIPDSAVIFIDAGSTTLCFAQLLSQRSGYTVITNSLVAANALSNSSNQIIITGGIAYNERVTKAMIERVGKIAPVTVYPGEDELLALAQGGLRVMNGEEEAKVYA